jgi:hypothetical protein
MTQIAISWNEVTGGYDYVYENGIDPIEEIAAAMFGERTWEIVEYDPKDPRLNIISLRDRRANFKFISEELLVHKFAASILGYSAAKNQAEYLSVQQSDVAAQIVSYLHSVYNATTQETISRLYEIAWVGKRYVFKVSNNQVTEYYSQPGIAAEQPRDIVAYDLTTGEAVEYYGSALDGDIYKFSLDGTVLATIRPAFTLSETIKDTLPNRVRDTMFLWSEKAYGTIIEYKE